MQDYIVKIENLSHRYSGMNWAIKDININVEKNGIIGLLGSNGAGKSTTMNILCGVLKQTEGDIFINGINMKENPKAAKNQIGFLPQHPPLYMDLTIDEYLWYCASLRQIAKKDRPKAIDAVKSCCGIAHFKDRLIKNLSGGYRQRVGIAQAIIHEPKVVVLDEPTNGLDPNQIIEVRKLIREIAEERVVIFSSHILSEVQLLCKDIKMIENGRIVFSDSMDAFNNFIEPQSLLLWLENMPKASELEKVEGVIAVQPISEKQVRIQFNGDQDITERIVACSVQNGWRLREINLEKNAVEEIFKQLSQNTNIN